MRISTTKPIAFDSPDHVFPWGTAQDNSSDLAFNRKLLWWIPKSQLRVLDLGCSGGGFVKSILDSGGFAVGIEGSDYSKIRKRAEWATIPEYLFTADITEPFQLLGADGLGSEQLMKFNVITAWEVMEHIREDKVDGVCRNILSHLCPEGVVIMSISPREEIINGIKLHQTVENKAWWVCKFLSLGLVHQETVLRYFGGDWVRAADSFHLVMTRSGESLPQENKLRFLTAAVQPLNGIRQVPIKMRKLVSSVVPLNVKRTYHRIRSKA